MKYEKIAFFRFFGRLNDFFRNSERIKTHRFTGFQTVKDRIEALGVPHVEVSLITLNGKPVGFDHMVEDGELFFVYPEFQNIEIPEDWLVTPRYIGEPRFVLDIHLGKLARLLRMLGFEAVFGEESDEKLCWMAVKKKAILLSRDTGLLKREELVFGYYVRNTDPKEQLVEVVERYDLKKWMKPFTRCIECGVELEEVPKEAVKNRVPPKVYGFFNEFARCPVCGRIYWKGSHYDHMVEFIKSNINKG
ncbi:Mut7-C RNAse domain-containing protein [Thermotoga petrophila]|uniref:Mut7-C RNAse domain-containing protein n=1 Tax=Thermotoga petrophila TaxID=93929 RepID=UPI002FE36252